MGADLIGLFDASYTDYQKDLFTEALDRKTQLQKTQLNIDTCVYTVHVPKLNTFCVIFENIDNIYFKNFIDLGAADMLHDEIVDLYGD